jgi:hypothetical protein
VYEAVTRVSNRYGQVPMGAVRTSLVAVLGTVLFLSLTGSVWASREKARDPVVAIRLTPGDVRVVADSSYPAVTAAGEHRVFRDLVLETTGAGTLRVTTSRPAVDPPEPLPLVVVLAGLRTGRESLGYLDEHGPNLLVGFQYPYDQQTFYENSRLTQLPAIRRAIHQVPAQVNLLAHLLASDHDVDSQRTALLGFSFGALFVPAVQRVAVEEGRPFHAMILAYGGADIRGLLHANLKVRPDFLRRRIAATGATLLHAMEPAHHLPHLPGSFLLIRGDHDHQIPRPFAERLANLAPEPKEVIVLAAGHMGPREPELTARVIELSQDWLVRQGVIAPGSLGATTDRNR